VRRLFVRARIAIARGAPGHGAGLWAASPPSEALRLVAGIAPVGLLEATSLGSGSEPLRGMDSDAALVPLRRWRSRCES